MAHIDKEQYSTLKKIKSCYLWLFGLLLFNYSKSIYLDPAEMQHYINTHTPIANKFYDLVPIDVLLSFQLLPRSRNQECSLPLLPGFILWNIFSHSPFIKTLLVGGLQPKILRVATGYMLRGFFWCCSWVHMHRLLGSTVLLLQPFPFQ